jgi:hypothetical protein
MPNNLLHSSLNLSFKACYLLGLSYAFRKEYLYILFIFNSLYLLKSCYKHIIYRIFP